MINWGEVVARLISTLMSWMHASNLRNQVFQLKDDKETLLIALEDIARTEKGKGSLAEKIALTTLDKYK